MSGADLVVVMPVFNDWSACRQLLIRLDDTLRGEHRAVGVVIVDDGSQPQPALPAALAYPFACLRPLVLRLRRNLGHQRAICVGLAYVHDAMNPAFTVVMDSDGEDAPEDVPRLLEHARAIGDSIVFARRTKRSESLRFRACYQAFRSIHRLATGHGITFGNFSVIPAVRLKSLVTVTDLWNNYAASVLVSKQPYSSIPTVRATRLDGDSRMSFLALVVHGLSAISVFGEVVAVRLASAGIVFFALTLALLALAVTGVVALSMPAVILTAVAAMAALQVTSMALLLAFLTLSRRNATSFQPARDYRSYIDAMVPLDVGVPQPEPASTT